MSTNFQKKEKFFSAAQAPAFFCNAFSKKQGARMEKADADAPHPLPLTCYAGAPPRGSLGLHIQGGVPHDAATRRTRRGTFATSRPARQAERGRKKGAKRMWLFSAQPRTEMPVKQAFRLSKEHKRVSRVQCDAVTATGVGACSRRFVGRGSRAISFGFAERGGLPLQGLRIVRQ